MFITFECGEGCGKSTQSKMLASFLTSMGKEVILTREVGGTAEAEKIREILLYNNLSVLTELFLVMAARVEHLNKVIIPALKNNQWVICDRFIDSTASYQGSDVNIGIDKIYELHEKFFPSINGAGAIMPDLTFFIDVPPELALERVHGRDSNNKFEEKDLNFHQNIYQSFIKIAKKFDKRIVSIDGTAGAAEVHDRIVKAVRNFR